MDHEEAHEHPGGGVDVGEHVLAVCNEGDGVRPLSDTDESETQEQVDDAHPKEDPEPLFELRDLCGVKQMGPPGLEDAEGGKDDEGPLETGREILYLPVAIRVALVGGLCGHQNCHQGQTARHHIDDGFQGV